MTFEFNFRNEFRGVSNDLGLFLPYVALPPITALDGNGSQGSASASGTPSRW